MSSFGQQLFVFAATVIGAYFGGPAGAVAASFIANALWAPEAEGPRLDDLKAQSSEYGRPIPIVYSVVAMQGNIIWASDLEDHESTVGGGLLGGGTTIHTYFSNFAVMICESDGDIQLGRIWAGPEKRLVYDPTGATAESGTVTFYSGADDQLPDPLMEAALGVGNVPAYKGRAMIVWEDFNVSDHDGNRVPFLTIEVGRVGSTAPASLGTVWFSKLWYSASLDSLISQYHGTYYGYLQNSGSTMLCENNVNTGRYSQTTPSFWDESGHKVVEFSAGFSYLNTYYTTAFPTGADTAHTGVMTVAAGAEGVGCCMVSSLYCFAYNCAVADGYGFKFHLIDPATHTVSAVYHIDTGATTRIIKIVGAAPSASWCWAFMDNGEVRRFDLNGIATTSTVIGTEPSGYAGASWDNSAMFNEYDGKLYAVRFDTATAYVAAYSSTAQIFNTSGAAPFFNLNSTPWYFSPVGAVYLTGTIWLAVDGRATVDALTGAVTGDSIKRLDDPTPCLSPLYVGTAEAQGWLYLPTMGGVVGTRYGGSWSETDVGSALDCATSSSGYMGDQDTSLEYQTLAEVVTDLSLRAGLTEADFDVTELTDQVDGYALASQMSVQAAVKALMPVYYFDAYEDQGIIVFRKRGGAMAVEVPDDDLGAAPAGASEDSAKDLVQITRKMDEELPDTFTVGYLLAATSYDTATKYARRLIGHSGNEASAQLPMVLTDQKAAEVAQVNLMVQWTERLAYQFKLPREYAYLAPTDVIGVHGHVVRLTKLVQKDGVFECEAVRDDAYSYTPTVVVTETAPPSAEAVATASLTMMEMM